MNGLIRSAVVLCVMSLTGCVTTGNEDVSADSYSGSGLGPSPLTVDRAEREVVDFSEQNAPSKGEFSVSDIDELPSITEKQIALLNSDPEFADPNKTITVSVDEIPVSEFIHHIYGDLLDLDYAIDPKVEEMRTKMVLRLQKPISQTELYKLAAGLLEENKVMVASKNNILYFQSLNTKLKKAKPVGIGSSVSDIPSTAGNIIQLIPYTFNSSQTIQRIVTKLTNATIYAYDDQKLIVAEGKYDELVRVVQLVNTLDVPSAKGRDIRYLNFVYSSTEEMVDLLSEILKKEGLRVGNSGDVAFVSVPRQNSVITYSTSSALGDRVVYWAKKLDKPEEGDKAKFYIYRPTYSKASDLYDSLSGFITSEGASRSVSVSKDSEGSRPASNTTLKSTSIIQSNDFKISVDTVQNSLLIQATPLQYRELLSLVNQLDQLPPQIALDVAIAEFDISDNFTAGISKFILDSSLEGRGNSGTLTVSPATGAASFAGIFGAATIDIDLIEEKTKSKVLSRPYLVVQDGQTASISAGDQVPVQTGSTTTDGGNTQIEIQYRTTGVQLTVTPTINAEGLVSLELSQSVSKSTPGAAELTPTITDRSLSTSVLVGNGQTAILGGLILNNDSNNGNAVPFFSAIPLIGDAFKYKKDAFSRSELVIMITPKILSDGNDLDDFSNSMKEVFTLPIGEPLVGDTPAVNELTPNIQ